MLESAVELSIREWKSGATLWKRKMTEERGVVLTIELPRDEALANLFMSSWKRELRLWWSAWADGLPVLEVRSWWRKDRKFSVWCVSSNIGHMDIVEPTDARHSNECAAIVSLMHDRELPHGNLEEIAFCYGDSGYEVIPPLNSTLLSSSFRERKESDKNFFFVTDIEKYDIQQKSAKNIMATFAAEKLSLYETLYPYTLDDDSGSENKEIQLRLLRNEPHPWVGSLMRSTASAFYHQMLSQSEGEQLMLVLNDSPDPLNDSGELVTVVADYQKDEDCLIVKRVSGKKFKSQRGWCHLRNSGTAKLMTTKGEILSLALKRKHIQRWVRVQSSKRTVTKRSQLVGSILSNEGLYSVQGPPGTGKTHLASEVVGALLREDRDARILVCAKEHQALKILKEKIIAQNGQNVDHHSLVSFTREIDGIDLEGTSENWARTITEKESSMAESNAWNKVFKKWSGQPPDAFGKLHEESARVIFATTTSWPMNKKRFSYFFEPFDFTVIEESGKCYPSELFPPLGLSRNALLIGDQNQLPPFQLEETTEAVDHLSELSRTRTEIVDDAGLDSMLKVLYEDTEWSEVKSWLQPFTKLFSLGSAFMLNEQYRMIPVLSDMISKIFYDTKFLNRRKKNESIPAFYNPIFGRDSLVWIDMPHSTEYQHAREDLGGHRFNNLEMEAAVKIVSTMRSNLQGKYSVAIITPYNAQVDRLAGKKGLNGALPSTVPGIPYIKPREDVYTVDSFQGNEADFVIVSLVRNNSFGNPHNSWGFVLNSERLNVMLSRARRQLIIIGCSQMIDLHSSHPEMERLVDVLKYFRTHGSFVSWKDIGGADL